MTLQAIESWDRDLCSRCFVLYILNMYAIHGEGVTAGFLNSIKRYCNTYQTLSICTWRLSYSTSSIFRSSLVSSIHYCLIFRRVLITLIAFELEKKGRKLLPRKRYGTHFPLLFFRSRRFWTPHHDWSKQCCYIMILSTYLIEGIVLLQRR